MNSNGHSNGKQAAAPANIQLNLANLSKNDYRGAPTTLCAGCGHNSIANQIIAAAYELNIVPEDVIKLSGIGCSSKSPAYFLNRSFGFNSLHGRMPSVATGAMFGDHHLKTIAVSGDGDTTNIGMGQFKHIMRRNVRIVYIVENNGVYGLTKGQFSATAETGLRLKYQGVNPYTPIDIVLEAMASGATFVARSFAGDANQVKALIKAALSHNGLAVLDIISPCVTFNNNDDARHSYSWGREHEEPVGGERAHVLAIDVFEPALGVDVEHRREGSRPRRLGDLDRHFDCAALERELLRRLRVRRAGGERGEQHECEPSHGSSFPRQAAILTRSRSDRKE